MCNFANDTSSISFLEISHLFSSQIFVKLFKDRASLIGATLLSVAGYGILIDLKTQVFNEKNLQLISSMFTLLDLLQELL